MIRLHFNKDLIKPTSELVMIAPLIMDKFSNESRFKTINDIDEKYVEYSNIEDCDYVVLPYKWDKNNPHNSTIINDAKNHNKKVLIFHIDDSDEEINVDNSIVFRTSFYKSTQKEYERGFPCFKDDTFSGSILNNPKLSIGFCGQVITKLRKDTIHNLKKSDLETDFIIRTIAWPGIEWGKSKNQVIHEFYENMDKNVFNLCIRGGGNFSYRLYETMMMGRIPILIDSDIVLPYPDIIDWGKCCVFSKNDGDLIEKILTFYGENDLTEVQNDNRRIWEEYLSPIGVVKNLLKTI